MADPTNQSQHNIEIKRRSTEEFNHRVTGSCDCREALLLSSQLQIAADHGFRMLGPLEAVLTCTDGNALRSLNPGDCSNHLFDSCTSLKLTSCSLIHFFYEAIRVSLDHS